MTALNKQALRERYSPQPVPKCHICGAEMTVQRISASRITYGCTGATYDDAGYHYAEGRSIADYHYEQSRFIVVDVSDPDVLALLDELDRIDARNADLNSTLERWAPERAMNAEALEAAEKRIAEQREYYEGVIADGSRRMAELEAKIETADKLQDSAFRHGLQHGFSYGQTNDQAGYEQCLKSYSSRGKDNG